MQQVPHVLAHLVFFALWFGMSLAVVLMLGAARRVAVRPGEAIGLVRTALFIERLPRTAFVLMLPAGLQLSANLGLISLQGAGVAGAWVLGVLWVIALWWRPPERGDALARGLRVVGRVLLAVVGGLTIGASLLSLVSPEPAMPSWLALKMGLFGAALFVTLVGDLLHDRIILLVAEDDPRPRPDPAVALGRAVPSLLALEAVLLLILLVAAWLGLVQAH